MKKALLLAALLLGAVICSAQTQPHFENGFKPYGSHDVTSIDSINTMNGNLQVHIGLPFNYPQRGDRISLPIYLQAMSKGWHANSYSYPCGGTCTGFGWGNPPGGIQLITSPIMAVSRVWQSDAAYTGGAISYAHWGYNIMTRDGANHPLSGNAATADSTGEPWSFDANDTSGFHLDLSGPLDSGGIPSTAIVTDRNGNKYQFGSWGGRCRSNANAGAEGAMPRYSGGWNLMNYGQDTVFTCNQRALSVSVTDSNGNVVDLANNLDMLGRSIYSASSTTDYSGCVGAVSSAMIYSFPAFSGGSAQLKLCSNPPTVATTFNVAGITEYPNWPGASNYDFPWPSRSWVTTAILPDGSKYTFSYDNFGEITSIGLPTGGSISYTWTTLALNPCNDPTPVSRAVASRSFNDGQGHTQTWTYAYSAPSQTSLSTVVTDPNQNDTVHIFTPLDNNFCMMYETSTRYYSGSNASGQLLKQVDTHYFSSPLPDDAGTPAAVTGNIVPDSIKTTVYPSNKVMQVTKSYDLPQPGTGVIFGNVVTEKVYDWGQGAPGALLRETDASYQWQANSAYLIAHLLDLSASAIVKDPSGNRMAETDYTYDEAAYLTTPTPAITTQHASPPYGVRGNPTTVSKWLSTTNSNVAGHANWYDTGELFQKIDPLGHTTTLSYDPAYAGAYVTQTCSPQTGTVSHCVSGTYDFSTGLLTSFTDQNNQTSNYVYDSMWRIQQAQAPPDPANSGARATTSLSYSTVSFPWSFTLTKSVTNSMSDSATTIFDGLGRPVTSQHPMPGGAATVDTVFDAVGHVASVSNPYFATTDPTYGITQTAYDALDRPVQITKQDGSISTASYDVLAPAGVLGNCSTAVDEAGKQRRTCSDALGRLVEVDEPNPSAQPIAAYGTLTINGTLQSQSGVGAYNPAPGGGSLTITGAERSITTGGDRYCAQYSIHGVCLDWETDPITTTYDSGTVTLTVNGHPDSTPYNSASNPVNIATGLAGAINSDAGAFVNASASNGVLTLAARQPGAATNYSWSLTSATSDSFDFGANTSSFSSTPTSGTLSGGTDGSGGVTVYDSGAVTVTSGSFSASASYGQGGNSTAAQVAAALAGSGATGLNRAGSPVTAVASGATITLTYSTPGSSGNGVIVSSSSQSTQTQWTFSPPSFTSTGTTLANGMDTTDLNNSTLVTQYQYDALGNLKCVEQHGNVTGTGCSAAASNDATSPWRVRRFTYDSFSRLLTAKNPESGTITYAYDNDGNLLQKISPAPNPNPPQPTQTISYCYDELHRVTMKDYQPHTYAPPACPITAPVVTYTYDQGANAKGKLTSLTDQAGTASYVYDPLGRISTETRVISGISKSLGYDYNLDGSVKALHYPSGAAITYTPDSAGRILSAIDSGNNINYVVGATYGPDGAITGFVSGGTVTHRRSYNSRLQPCRITASTGPLPLNCADANPADRGNVLDIAYDFHFQNNNNGNVYGITNYKDSNRSQSFTYDPLNRLTSAQNAGTDCNARVLQNKTEYWGNSYVYDAWGNLLQKNITKCGAENLQVTADPHNWLHTLAAPDYQYDAAGNMTSDPTDGVSLTYDQENRITGAAGYAYTYDADGNRVKKSNGSTGTLYWYMTPGIVAESDLAGATKSEYVFFSGERVARRDGVNGAGGVFYYFSDHLKTASVITDSAGNIKAESDYYPWGGELQFVNADSNHYKFTGKERDTETGLDYFGARYYSSALGRFVSADWSPIPHPVPYADFRDPQTLNLSSYVRNLPTTRFDVDGHDPQGRERTPAEEEAEAEAKARAARERDPNAKPEPDPLVRAGETLERTRENELSDRIAKENDAKVAGGYDDVTGTCHVNPPAPQSGPSVSAPNSPPRAPEYIVSPGGNVVLVPKGANPVSPVVNEQGRTTGFAFTGGSGGNNLHPNVTTVRIMDPTPARGPSPGYPNGYVVYQNATGQTVNPQTGRPIPPNDPMAHIPLSPPKPPLTRP